MTRSLSGRDFNQDIGKAKRMADEGPVVITDRGTPAYVLMTNDEYERLTGKAPSILELLADPGGENIEFEPRRLTGGSIRKVELE